MANKEYIIKIKFESEDIETVQEVGALLQNIASKVDKTSLKDLYQQVKKDSNFFKKIVSKLNNPMVKNFFS